MQGDMGLGVTWFRGALDPVRQGFGVGGEEQLHILGSPGTGVRVGLGMMWPWGVCVGLAELWGAGVRPAGTGGWWPPALSVPLVRLVLMCSVPLTPPE